MTEAHIIKGRDPISEEQMYELYKVDKQFRDTARLKHNNRTTTIKRADGEVGQSLNHQTTLELKPKYGSLVPERTVEILTALLAEKNIKSCIPTSPFERKEVQNDKLGGIVFSDLHFDRLDIKATPISQRMRDATEHYKRAVDRVLMFDPSELLVGDLGDTSNTDGRYTTTSGKHSQQNSVFERDAFQYIFERSVEMLEYMQQFGLPVEHARVSGNHDELTAQHLGVALQAYFRNSNINIVVQKNRFYKERGNILIMLSHGQNEAPKRTLEIAVNEFVRKKYNQMYSYMGHKHIKEMQQVGPMVNKRVGALVPPSEREDKFGYRPYKGMSGFVWDKSEGEIADLKG